MLELPTLPPRLIPCLLLQDDVFVKTEKFKKPIYIGDPVNTINLFNKFEVDEIVVIDIESTLKNKAPNFSLISELASECWVPLTYGGGIRSVDDARKILNSGVEKIIVETMLFSNPSEVQKCVKEFGASSVVACLSIKKNIFGRYEVRTSSGRKKISLSLEQALNKVSKLGVGELLINDISREGTRAGYDACLVKTIADQVTFPVIALGGASAMSDFKKIIDAGASAVGAGSFFVFQNNAQSGVLISFPNRKEIEDLFRD